MATKKEIEHVFGILKLEPRLGTFQDRIKLQKCVYLAENAFGVNLGFNFDWYIHGPYSPDLTKVMFEKDEGVSTKLTDADRSKLIQCKEFLKEYSTSNDLELLGSFHYFLSVVKTSGLSKEKIIEQFLELKPKFTKKSVQKIYSKIDSKI